MLIIIKIRDASLYILPYLCILITFEKLYAQGDTTNNFNAKYYFDDNNISNAKNIVKLNVASAAIGDASFQYERKVFKRIAIEGGLGLLLPYYIPENDALIINDQDIYNPRFGFSYCLFPKLYYGKAPEKMYYGILWRRRFYHLSDHSAITFSDLTFQEGYQFMIGRRLVIDCNVGLGIRFKKYMNNASKPVYQDRGFAIPIALSVGYKF